MAGSLNRDSVGRRPRGRPGFVRRRHRGCRLGAGRSPRVQPVGFRAARPTAAGGGLTTPIEMMYFSAWSTLISSSTTSLRGTIRKKPEVGFGVVGTYRLRYSPVRCVATSPPGRPVTKAIVQEPWRGYCTRTASRKALPLVENRVSETCLTEL